MVPRDVERALDMILGTGRPSDEGRLWSKNRLIIPLIVGLTIALWYAVTEFGGIPKFLLPRPLDVMRELWDWRDEMPKHLLITLVEALVGFVLSLLIGVPLASALILFPIVRQVAYPFIVAFQGIPKIIVAPLLVIWLGFGLIPKALIAFSMCIFPVVVNTATGLNSAPMELIDLMKTFRSSEWQVLTRIRFPLAIPYIFSSVKISIVMAMTGALVGEFIGSEGGLGYLIATAIQYMDTARAFGVVLLASVTSIALFALADFAERAFVPWESSVSVEKDFALHGRL